MYFRLTLLITASGPVEESITLAQQTLAHIQNWDTPLHDWNPPSSYDTSPASDAKVKNRPRVSRKRPDRRDLRRSNPTLENPGRMMGIQRQHYVDIDFTFPSPSLFGLLSYESWGEYERGRSRRLIAFTCMTHKSTFKASISTQVIVGMNNAPLNSLVVSCIYLPRNATYLPHSCIITSYDLLNLVEWMLNSPSLFIEGGMDEKNRIRRYLAIFAPVTFKKKGAFDQVDVY